MPWDTRGARRYYYRSRKVGGRVVRTYVGTGAVAEQAATEDARRRAERQAEAAARQEAEARWREALAPLQEFLSVTDFLTHATLLTAGYHRHAGTWRKRRHAQTQDPPLRTPSREAAAAADPDR